MSAYVGTLCHTCGRSRWKQMRTEGWFVNRTRNECLRGGRILLCSAFCVAGSRGISPRIVDLTEHCLHTPKHYPPPLRLPRLFDINPSVVYVWGASSYGADRSSPAKVCRQGFCSAQTSVYVGPDLSEDDSSTGSSSEPSSPSSSSTSGCVVVSPSHYPTPEEPDVSSAASSLLISPNRVREDCVSVTAEVYPVFEVSPDNTRSVLTSTPGPPSSPSVSLPPLAPTFSPLGAPLSLDGLVLAFPLLPVPYGMVLVPVVTPVDLLSSPERPTRGKSAPV